MKIGLRALVLVFLPLWAQSQPVPVPDSIHPQAVTPILFSLSVTLHRYQSFRSASEHTAGVWG